MINRCHTDATDTVKMHVVSIFVLIDERKQTAISNSPFTALPTISFIPSCHSSRKLALHAYPVGNNLCNEHTLYTHYTNSTTHSITSPHAMCTLGPPCNYSNYLGSNMQVVTTACILLHVSFKGPILRADVADRSGEKPSQIGDVLVEYRSPGARASILIRFSLAANNRSLDSLRQP